MIQIRSATEQDRDIWLALRLALWPGDEDGHRGAIDRFFAGDRREPAEVLLAFASDGKPIGLVELSIRNIVDSCETDRVAYLEGWYVVPGTRRQGAGGQLVAAAEEWARGQGCVEFASDALIDNEISHQAHLALGFEETGRVVNFRKSLSGRRQPIHGSAPNEVKMKPITACALFLGILTAVSTGAAQDSSRILSQVDHLVYATLDLDRTVADLERRLGVRATPGGQHPGRGTRNALIALGANSYLEIIGPDPEQPSTNLQSLWFNDLKEPRLVTWAAKGTELERLRDSAVSHGVPMGEVSAGSRKRPDDVLLSWRTVSHLGPAAGGIIPFFIDWGDSPHPALSSARGVTLAGLRAEHPDHRQVREMLGYLGLELPVTPGERPVLIATLLGPRGRVELR
jgi:RimJ/RimL family protein N-acetyltransferase